MWLAGWAPLAAVLLLEPLGLGLPAACLAAEVGLLGEEVRGDLVSTAAEVCTARTVTAEVVT